MRAIIIATCECQHYKILGQRYIIPLLPIVDRPLIQLLVEKLISQGIVEFDIILCHLPEQVEKLLGDGKRWGVKFNYHLVKEPEQALQHIKIIEFYDNDYPILLVNSNSILNVDLKNLTKDIDSYLLFFFNNQNKNISKQYFTGWGLFSNKTLLLNHIEKIDYFEFADNLNDNAIFCSNYLKLNSINDLIEVNKSIINKNFTDLTLTGREIEDGIWLSRNVSIHPTAKLTPPIYLCHNCHIDKGVQIGPNVVVCQNSLIDQKSIISNSIILHGTYVGEALEVDNAVVDENLLINTNLKTETTITESFILGSLSPKNIFLLSSMLLRLIASLFLFSYLPILLIFMFFLKIFRKGPVVFKKQFVKTPTFYNPILWQTGVLYSFRPYPRDNNQKNQTGFSSIFVGGGISDFFFRFIPALISVANGDLELVGVCPRSHDELDKLSKEWKSLYIKSKPGIITGALVTFGKKISFDELYVAESMHCIKQNFKHDFKIFIKYLLQIIRILPLPNKMNSPSP